MLRTLASIFATMAYITAVTESPYTPVEAVDLLVVIIIYSFVNYIMGINHD